MLHHLHIRHFALIREVEVNLQAGFNVITGETGAGKSILLQALGLILGDRADASSIRHGEEKCVVEAHFQSNTASIITWLNQQQLDIEPLLTLRREITRTGKSRAFINDTPVSLQQMRELAAQLVDLHEQTDTSTLHARHFRYELVDVLADCLSDRTQYQEALIAYKTLAEQLHEKKAQAEAWAREQDYLQFQFDELALFKPLQGEIEALTIEAQTLSHAEKISANLNEASQLSEDGEWNVYDLQNAVHKAIQQASRYHKPAELLAERIQSALFEWKDIADELTTMSRSIVHDPLRLEEVENRLAQYQQLLRKHQVADDTELVRRMEALDEQLITVKAGEEGLEKLTAQVAEALTVCRKKAKALFEKRSAAIPSIEKNITLLLKEVGMAEAQFAIRLQWEETDIPGPFGGEQLSFWFSANAGMPLEPLSKVASGGETSRLMLCLKTVLAGKTQMPTLIFDEIDTGISGDTARKVGRVMAQLGQRHQVIAITHLPQMAAQGDLHFHISKSSERGETETTIALLNAEERVEELARMLSGVAFTDSALKTARELMEN